MWPIPLDPYMTRINGPVSTSCQLHDAKRHHEKGHTMAVRHVTSTGKATDGDITKLCGSFGSISKQDAISDIEDHNHVYKSGDSRIEVVHDSTVSGGKYLRTRPGGGTANNLESLPDC
jgi:Protein of unknown function (DUF3892)